MRKKLSAAIILALTLFPAATQTITANADSAACFVLCESDGNITLFSEDDPAPLAVYATPLSELSSADAERLRAGIRLKTRAEVRQLVEALGVE